MLGSPEGKCSVKSLRILRRQQKRKCGLLNLFFCDYISIANFITAFMMMVSSSFPFFFSRQTGALWEAVSLLFLGEDFSLLSHSSVPRASLGSRVRMGDGYPTNHFVITRSDFGQWSTGICIGWDIQNKVYHPAHVCAPILPTMTDVRIGSLSAILKFDLEWKHDKSFKDFCLAQYYSL